jgi:hypothetical protein
MTTKLTPREKELLDAVIMMRIYMSNMHNVQGLKAWAFRENVQTRSLAHELAYSVIAKFNGE